MKQMILLAVLIFSTLSLSAQKNTDHSKWELTSRSINASQKIPYIYFDINTSNVSGFSGCNRFSGAYSVDSSQNIKFSPLASTRMMCPMPQMDIEMYFFKQIAKVTTFSMGVSTLKFLNADKAIVLEFSKVE